MVQKPESPRRCFGAGFVFGHALFDFPGLSLDGAE
jgi:hypothetical protein